MKLQSQVADCGDVAVNPYSLKKSIALIEAQFARLMSARVLPVSLGGDHTITLAEVRERIGTAAPVYLSFDIDGLDPSVAPGTGTPEPAGLTASQGLEIIRGCFGLNLVGGDLVEVSPPYDVTGNTALLAANLVFEMLCCLPGCKRR